MLAAALALPPDKDTCLVPEADTPNPCRKPNLRLGTTTTLETWHK